MIIFTQPTTMKKIITLLAVAALISTSAFSQTWTNVTQAPVNGRYDDMYFINDSVGFISQNSEVYRTTDRGEHWTLLSYLDTVSQYVRSIEFINDTIGFAGLLVSSSQLTGILYRTIDGGLSWELLQNMPIQPYEGICGMAHYGNRVVGVGTYGTFPWFYRSDDFGDTWVRVPLNSFASGMVDVYMLNNDTILISGISDSASGYKANILKSYDGGNTWQQKYLGPYPTTYAWKMFFRPSGLGLTSIEFGFPTLVARTTDWGETWTTHQVYNNFGDIGGIGLLNDTLGWVMDQHSTGTWQTDDGGLTWHQVLSAASSGDRMVQIDSVTMLACGQSVYKYSALTTGTETLSPVTKKIHELNVYPNPANQYINIEAIAGTNTFGLLDIITDDSRPVKRIAQQLYPKGKNNFTVDVSHLAEGSYKVLWRSNETFLVTKFVVTR
jgi:photosystem II stability/assembly factor-like uncharacterized protein